MGYTFVSCQVESKRVILDRHHCSSLHFNNQHLLGAIHVNHLSPIGPVSIASLEMQPKFAYQYPEGYLHCVTLGEGCQGTASICSSQGKVYVVRKAALYTREFEIGYETGEWCPEASHYRAHPNINKLIAFQHYPSDYKIHASLIHKYCNGGNLKDFFDSYMKIDLVVPEGLIFRMLQQMLGALNFLQQECRPAVSHGDLFMGNILVDWPSHNNWRPNFLLADFGHSAVHDLEPAKNSNNRRFLPNPEAACAFAQDYEDLAATAVYLMTGDVRDRRCKTYCNEIRLQEYYSEDLVSCIDDIHEYSEELETNINAADLTLLREFVTAKARSRCNMPLDCVRPAPISPTPMLFNSYEELMNKEPRPPGPWNVVTVNPETYKVIGKVDGPHCSKEVWFTDLDGIRMEMHENPAFNTVTLSEDSLPY